MVKHIPLLAVIANAILVGIGYLLELSLRDLILPVMFLTVWIGVMIYGYLKR